MTSIYSNESIETQEAKDSMQQAKDAATQAAGQVQQKAQEMASQAKDQAKSMAATRKDQAVEQLGGVAQAFRTTSSELRNQEKDVVAQYVDKVAEQVDRFSGYLQERDVDQLMTEAEDFARRRPELFLGGAFIAGLLVGRFIKSSGERRRRIQHEQMMLRNQAYPYPEDYVESRPFDRSGDFTSEPRETSERFPAL